MKALKFTTNGKEFTTDKPFVLAAATVKTENGQTLVNFAKNDKIAAQLVQQGFTPINDNPRKATPAKDYWFAVEVTE